MAFPAGVKGAPSPNPSFPDRRKVALYARLGRLSERAVTVLAEAMESQNEVIRLTAAKEKPPAHPQRLHRRARDSFREIRRA